MDDATAPEGSRDSQERARFVRTAGAALDVLLEHDPVSATELGDHRFDDRLADLGHEGVAAAATEVGQALGALDDLDETGLDDQDRVDLEMLRTRLSARLWSLTELREHEWDPLVHVPGDAIYSLLARPATDPHGTARALTARLRGLPEALATAREVLTDMPRVHAETAALQTRGAVSLLGAEVDALLERAPEERGAVDEARALAAEELEAFARWLEDRVPASDRDPRLGTERYAARLWYALDTETSPDALLTHAESDLMAVEEEISDVAARLAPLLGVHGAGGGGASGAGPVRAVLDRLAALEPVTDATILPLCRDWLAETTELVRAADLVTVHDDAVDVIEMPESRRGVSVAYCDPPGPLEPDGPDGPPATFFAVSPTPADWPPDRVASFYREYNRHMLRNLTVHEAMPGHVLQLSHARRFARSGRASTPLRAALWNGAFVEGWAVYAEQLVADVAPDHDSEPVSALALRMQQLKMQLRTTINAILDVRVHAHGMSQDEAMALMTRRGHQEEGEAAGKWRRALLTSAQLPTYYVGYREVQSIVADLRDDQPGWSTRRVHDAVLSHGSPSPRLLRGLLGLVDDRG